MWVNYPENTPEKPGYYFTEYFNTEQNRLLYKSFYWDDTDKNWAFRFTPDVRRFMPDTYSKFYVPSHMKGLQMMVDNPLI